MLGTVTALLLSFSPDATPSPELSVKAVVELQLEGLRRNPTLPNDAGIRLAFRFASPANKAQTGPVERFIPMVKSPTYAPLLGFDDASVAVISDAPEGAHLVVEVRRGDTANMYMWVLSRQSNGAWMTDAVVPIEPDEAPPGTLSA